MRIGYPCLNYSVGCTSSSTFRLKNYSRKKLLSKVSSNLTCLEKILDFNKKKGIGFFRISSDLIPFASHPICRVDWEKDFKETFIKLGEFILKNHMRVSMHPDQFVVINSKNKDVVKNSIKELDYHCRLLDIMKMPPRAKIQIHAGGVYGNKKQSIKRFLREYGSLNKDIKKRLVIENDDRSYSVRDCLEISARTGVPVVYDTLHQTLNGDKSTHKSIMRETGKTWKRKDGIPMVDYSTQLSGGRPGRHALTIDTENFKKFLSQTGKYDFDLMLEIKDKEKSALRALKAAEGDARVVKGT